MSIKDKYSEDKKNGFPVPHWVETSPSGEVTTAMFVTDQKDSVTVDMHTLVNGPKMQDVSIRQDVRLTYDDLSRLRNLYDTILEAAVRRGVWLRPYGD